MKCSIEFCNRDSATGRKLCPGHRQQKRLGKELTPIRDYEKQTGPCSFESCEDNSRKKGLCNSHYKQKLSGMVLRPIHFGLPYREDSVRFHVDLLRANKYGAFVEDVSRLVVLERDDGVCGICEQDVDPLDFHIDHIIPLSRGGEHSYVNVQVAHPSCNRSKSNNERL